MKRTNSYTEFVEYDDEKLSHVSSAPQLSSFYFDEILNQDSFEEFYLNRYTFNGFSFKLVLK